MCLRGASAVDDMLKRHSGWKLRVFVVWEAIRNADTLGPPAGTYARIPDRRVRQFWDRDLSLSQRILHDVQDNPKLLADSGAVLQGTTVWDVAAAFPPKVRWDRAMPKPDYYGRPVAEIAPDLEKRLEELITARP
jgi:hypothetical protein